MKQRFDFLHVGRLDGRTELGDGSVRYNARLTRTGVFDYGDHKELRTPEEVFKKSALDSFKGLTVTEGHRAMVDPDNWKDIAIGHLGDDVRQDGDFVAASLILKDANAIAKADAGELVEISMGYSVELDETPGVTKDGEKYDAVQTNILGNHAAMGPSNWGRAGSRVRLLDGGLASDMSGPKSVNRIDAPATNTTDDASALRRDLDSARVDRDALRKERDDARTERDAEKKRADQAEAERDAAKNEAKKTKEDADAAQKSFDSKIDARVALVDTARVALGADFAHAGKTDRDIRVAVITKLDPEFKADGKSDDYLAARFDLDSKNVTKERTDLANTNEVTTKATQTKEDESPLDKARAESAKRREEEAKGGAPKGARVRQ